MRAVLLLVCCGLVAGFQWVGGHAKNANENVRQQEQDQREARRLWEQALAAKGGREKLHRVANLLESYQDKSHVGLHVFPNKLWNWTDDRPTWLGVYVKMINLDHDLSYDVDESSVTPVNRGRRNASDWPIVEIQLYYLLETQWVKPRPVKLYSGTIGRRPVDIVQTIVIGYRVDFHLDKQSHLPLEVAFPSRDSEGTNYGRGTYYATFAEYADVNGIQMPQKVGHMTRPKIPLSVQVNVAYDPDIFERPPRLKDGSDGWRPVSLPASK